MSDSENEGEIKRLTNVDELKEILASFDAADRKTSARGVKESLRAARAVIEQIWLVRGRNRMKMTMSP